MSLTFPNSPSTNDTHVTGGSTWIFNGEMWVRQGTSGAQGIQGTQGNTGFGIQGLRGNQGVQGIQGTQGTQGLQGLQGVQGNQGVQGLQGVIGPQVTARTYTFTAVSLSGGGNAYAVDGIQQDTLHLIRGQKYIFDGSAATSHPIRLSTDSGNSSAYTSGYTVGSNNTHTFVVPFDAPDTLYYYCSNHSNMGASITVRDLTANDLQGTQGLQGISNQGVQGLQGLMGIQGHQGVQGTVGADGNFGGATFDYTFKTATADENPGQGNLRSNNANLSSATLLYIHDADGGGTDIQSFLRTIDDSTSTIKGHVRISNRLNADDFTIFTISGTNTEVSGYHKVSVSYLSGATSFSNSEDIIVTFARTGTKGDTGATGPQGVQGLQGLKGSQGVQGLSNQGVQGLQGILGTTGSAGATGSQGTTGSSGSNGAQGTAGTAAGGATGVDYNDNVKVRFGDDQDSEIYFTGTKLKIHSSNQAEITSSNQFYFRGGSNGLFLGSGGQTTIATYGGYGGGIYFYNNNTQYLKLEYGKWTTQNGADFTFTGSNYNIVFDASEDALEFADNAKAKFGTGDDLQIFHDGSNNYIQGATGNLILKNNNSDYFIGNNSSGSVELNYNGSKKFETVTGGISVTGDITCTQHIDLGDSQQLKLGASDDLKIFHNGTNSYVANSGTGNLIFQNGVDDQDIILNCDDGSGGNAAYFRADGSTGEVVLYHYGSEKLNTKSDGVLVTGELQATTLDINGNVDIDDGQVVFFATDNKMRWADDAKATFGTGDDLQLFHNGANSVIDGGGAGSLFFLASEYRFRNAIDTEDIAKFTENGAVTLYYNGSKKIETTNDGVKITGALQDADGDLGTSGQVLSSTGAALNWVDADSGPQGVQGLKGNNGSSGSNGAQGIAGSDGSNGAQGVQGTAGLVDSPYGAVAAYGNSSQSNISWDNTEQAMKLYNASDTTIGAAFPAFPVNVTTGEVYTLSIRYKASAADANGLYIRIYEYDGSLPDGKVAVSHNSSSSVSTVQEDTRKFGNWKENAAVTTDWITTTFTYTPTSTANWTSIVVLNWNDMGTKTLFLRDPSYELQASTGPQGVQGIVGSDGSNGSNGSNGAQGTQGSAGSNGSNGSNGAQGTQGEQGPAGGSTGTDYNDNVKVRFGTGNDLEIYHSGSHSYIKDVGQGNFYFATNRFEMRNAADNESIANFIQDGAVELYYDNSKTFATATDGASIFGNLGFRDNDKIAMGQSSDLQIYHDETNSIIDNRTGDLYVQTTNSGDDVIIQAVDDVFLKPQGGENGIQVLGNGSVRIAYDNVFKLDTKSDGVEITGHCYPESTNTYDLGASGKRWRNVYTNDLNLSNEGSTNDVDGTWGDYTIQEGEDDLFLINRRSGKKYKFMLQEVE